MNLFERKPLPLNCSKGEKFDVIVFGSGLAGLTSAFYASQKNNSIALIYSSIKKSSSFKAKGGLAAPIAKGDSVKKHVNDTLIAGAGLCDEKTVEFIVKKSIPQIKELISFGLNFDEVNGKIHLGKEGGHSENRVLHISGDKTGKGLIEFMTSLLKEKGIHLIPNTNLIDLNSNKNKINSAVIHSKKGFELIKAKSFIIATGGYSSIYSNSTNSIEAKGNALNAAFRAGITLKDLEFVQFHPTTLKRIESNFVVTESLRGENALIVNSEGKRFLKNYSPLMELSTRDIITKAIYEQEFSGKNVFLNAKKIGLKRIQKRFPALYEELVKQKINSDKELIPITASAHYCIGGIKTNLNAQTNYSNVFSAGESACTEFHGANRLACNSLLETIVMGKIAGKQSLLNAKKQVFSHSKPKKSFNSKKTISLKKEMLELRKKMWLHAGIMKSKKHLLHTKKFIELNAKKLEFNSNIDLINYFNALQLSNLIVSFALKRKESRGVHQRVDWHNSRKKWLKHQKI
jgi:L-aspartate oxidase